ncbi:TIGR03905 family TSCPD domain-containing protein [Natranaerovirga pectinivora]|nr:TIGR03905 family TSCPD domain-containing protein [Natranaerovirga pectinivora]
MKYTYKTVNICSKEITFDINDNVITNVEFVDGCNGNLKAISHLIDGWTVEKIIEKCSGIICERKLTSCSDQLAQGVKKAYEDLENCI